MSTSGDFTLPVARLGPCGTLENASRLLGASWGSLSGAGPPSLGACPPAGLNSHALYLPHLGSDSAHKSH